MTSKSWRIWKSEYLKSWRIWKSENLNKIKKSMKLDFENTHRKAFSILNSNLLTRTTFKTLLTSESWNLEISVQHAVKMFPPSVCADIALHSKLYHSIPRRKSCRMQAAPSLETTYRPKNRRISTSCAHFCTTPTELPKRLPEEECFAPLRRAMSDNITCITAINGCAWSEF